MRYFLVIFLLSLIQWGCSHNNQGSVKNLSAAEFKTAIESTTPKQLIDVRTDDEVSHGKIGNAQQIDFSRADFEQQLDQLDKSQPIYLYCAVGGRSAQAADICAHKGFKEVYNLTGGIQEWMQAGNPINR